MYIGDAAMPEELKTQFDVCVASGVWGHGHIQSKGLHDIFGLLKPGGLFVTGMRTMYWVNGDDFGYKDTLDDYVSRCKAELIKSFTFIRGVPGGDKFYAEQTGIVLVYRKLEQ